MSDVLMRMRLLGLDHAPDGWPAVKMIEITALCDLAAYWRNCYQQTREMFVKETGFHHAAVKRAEAAEELIGYKNCQIAALKQCLAERDGLLQTVQEKRSYGMD